MRYKDQFVNAKDLHELYKIKKLEDALLSENKKIFDRAVDILNYSFQFNDLNSLSEGLKNTEWKVFELASLLSNENNLNLLGINIIPRYNSCEKSKKQKSFKTYLMTDSNTGYTKIGKSFNPEKREKTLQSEKPTISLFAVCKNNIETKLHNRFKTRHQRGEWYRFTNNEVLEIVKDYGFKIVSKTIQSKAPLIQTNKELKPF